MTLDFHRKTMFNLKLLMITMNILLRKGINSSGGVEEVSSSLIHHLDAKSEETSRMNLPKLREWSKDHPWLLVLGDPDGWVTMGAIENEYLIFGFLSEEEPKKVEEALMDPDWVIAKQDELSRIERQITLKLIPRIKDKTVIDIWWVFRKKLDEDEFVRGTRSNWLLKVTLKHKYRVWNICTSSKTSSY